MLAHASPLRNKLGQVIGGVNLLIDISDRTDAQTRLNDCSRQLSNRSDDAIVAKTLDGRILSWNGGAERLFGYTASEIIGSPITVIIPPEQRDRRDAGDPGAAAAGRADQPFRNGASPSRALLDISLTISPIRDRTGRVVAASPKWHTISHGESGRTRQRHWCCSRTSWRHDSPICGGCMK